MQITKRLYYLIGGLWALLLIPFIAMQFTSEVTWMLGDFLIMGMLLLVLATVIEYVLQRTITKLIWVLLAIFLFFLLWAELGVGIFGSPIAGN